MSKVRNSSNFSQVRFAFAMQGALPKRLWENKTLRLRVYLQINTSTRVRVPTTSQTQTFFSIKLRLQTPGGDNTSTVLKEVIVDDRMRVNPGVW